MIEDLPTLVESKVFSPKSKSCPSLHSLLGLQKLWQSVLVIPSSTTMCERDFSEQNLIKSHVRASLKLEILDAMMFIFHQQTFLLMKLIEIMSYFVKKYERPMYQPS